MSSQENGKKVNKKLAVFGVILGIVGLLALGGVLFMKSPLFQVDFTTPETHLELGQKMTTDPDFYLDGEEWAVSLSYVDTSSVKKSIGRYPVYIYHGFEKYTCYVSVTDTTAPVITCDIQNLTVKPGEIVSISSLGLNVEDYSEIESLAFTRISSTRFYTGLPEDQIADMIEAYRKGIDMWGTEFQFAYGGIYELTITAEDSFHNTSEVTFTLKVEQPPVIEVPSDFYVAKDTQVEYLDYVTAWDFIDEDLNVKDVNVDTSALNLSASGDYSVVFTVTDSYGMKASATAIVHVHSADELQEMINTHQINVSEHIIVGAYNPYDSGYYTDTDLATVQEYMLPCFVHVENDKLETYGSGFIISIDEEFVTITTNEHVISDDLTADITFYDGTVKKGSVVASDAREDIAFIRIPINDTGTDSSISSEEVKNLRSVHIYKSYWDTLSNENSANIAYTCIDANGNVWATGNGTILEKFVLRDWNSYTNVRETIISITPLAGSSGSALLDEQGNLLGMVRGYTDYETHIESVAVPLSEILDYYEIIFKERVEYQ